MAVRTVTMEEYSILPRPNVVWIAEKLIPKPSIILLLGQEKIGKSFLALDIGNRLANGHKLLGHEVKAPVRVLYLQFDTSEAIWRDRISELIAGGYDLSSKNYVMIHPEDNMVPFDILSARGELWLKSCIETAKPDVVIIDVLREIHNRDENDSKEMKLVGDALTRMFRDVAVILIHHTRKQSTDPRSVQVSIGQLARGSSYAAGKVDAFWYLQDGKLSTVNRFDTSHEYTAQRLLNGIWDVSA